MAPVRSSSTICPGLTGPAAPKAGPSTAGRVLLVIVRSPQVALLIVRTVPPTTLPAADDASACRRSAACTTWRAPTPVTAKRRNVVRAELTLRMELAPKFADADAAST